MDLVDLLDGGSGSRSSRGSTSSSCSWHTSGHSSHVRHPTRSPSSRLVQLGDDGVADSLNLLLLLRELLNLGQLVGVKPLDGLIALVADQLLIVSGDLVGHLLIVNGGLHVEAVTLQAILGRDPVLLLVVLVLELLSVVDHTLDLFFGQTTLVIGDSDLVLLAGALVAGGNVQDTVGINVEGDLDLRNTSGCRRNASQVEFAKEMVVLGHGPLTLVHLDGDSGLVVRVGGEGLGLLGGDGGVPLDEAGHHTSGSLDSKGERSNIKQEEVGHSLRGISGQDGGLHCGSIGHGLVRVDGLVQLLPVEEILQQFLYLRDPGGASDQDDVIYRGLV